MTTDVAKAEPYRVLARKYRPQNFDDLIGQEPMVQTLTNAFETGRIAQAYMLTGVRGVGKTTTARILARALNFQSETIDRPTVDLSEPGVHCPAIMEGRHVDIIEMDAASHTGIDDIRDLIESAQYKPVSARYKVYIIDEVHMLSKSAFNGLLKTLEEPPEHLKFVFATTEIRKVPITILSRCQRFDLRRIEAEEMVAHLARISDHEKVRVEDEALALIARASEGSVRDALSILDQAISHSANEAETGIQADGVRDMLGLADRTRVVDLFHHIMSGNVEAALLELKAQYDVGAEPLQVLSDLADFIHFVTKLKYVKAAAEDKSLSETERSKGTEFSEKLSVRVLGRAWQILLKGISEVQSSERPLMAADMVLIRLTHASDLPNPDDLVRKLEATGASSASVLTTQSAQTVIPAAPTSPSASSQIQSSGTNAVANTPLQQSQSAVSEGNVAPAMNMAEPASAPQPEKPEPDIVLDSFEELIFLVEDKRDLQLKTGLRRNVRLVSFANGRIELRLVGNPLPTFLTDLSQKLHKWTGQRWMIATSQAEGQPTLEEVEKAEGEAQIESARNNPLVESILQQFPGSKIIDVRIKENAPNNERVEADDPTTEGLDDFFD